MFFIRGRLVQQACLECSEHGVKYIALQKTPEPVRKWPIAGQAIPFLFVVGLLWIQILSCFPPQLVHVKTAGGLHHDAGDSTALREKAAQRVIFFSAHLEEYVTLDQGFQHIAAAAHYYKNNLRQTLLSEIYPVSWRISFVGGDSAAPGDPEELLALSPDAIFTWTWSASMLRQFDLPVIALQSSFRREDAEALSVESWRAMSRIAAANKRAEGLLDFYQQEESHIRIEMARSAGLHKPRVLALFVYSDGLMSIMGNDTFTTELIDSAGGVDAAASLKGGVIGKEQLLRLDPDVILIGCTTGERYCASSIMQDPASAPLHAVRNRRVYQTPFSLYRVSFVETPFEQRWMLALLTSSSSGCALRGKIRATYDSTFGYSLSQQQISKMLRVEENMNAANYSQFDATSSCTESWK